MKPNKSNFIEAIWSFLFTLILGVLPTWGLFLVSSLYQQPFDLYQYTQNGEFALYSASLISAIFYLSVKDYLPRLARNSVVKSKYPFEIKGSMPLQNLFLFFAVIIIIASTILFVAVTIARLPYVQGLSPNIEFLSLFSFGLFLFSSFLSYITTVFDIAASTNYGDTEYRQDLKSGQTKLENQLNEMLEGR